MAAVHPRQPGAHEEFHGQVQTPILDHEPKARLRRRTEQELGIEREVDRPIPGLLHARNLLLRPPRVDALLADVDARLLGALLVVAVFAAVDLGVVAAFDAGLVRLDGRLAVALGIVRAARAVHRVRQAAALLLQVDVGIIDRGGARRRRGRGRRGGRWRRRRRSGRRRRGRSCRRRRRRRSGRCGRDFVTRHGRRIGRRPSSE
jgi:hypothetical protein